MFKVLYNDACHFGINSIKQIAEEARERGLSKCFIITDSGMIESGVYQKIINIFLLNKMQSVMFSDISSEPTVSEVKNACNALKHAKADYILAVGGGSVIDVAKAVSVVITNPKFSDVISLKGEKNLLNPPLTVFAVPTTAGSAAEVSKSFVVFDEFMKRPIICKNDAVLPKVTFIDPELMLTMPDIVTLSSGFDALTHAIESLISKDLNMFSETLSKEAIKLIVKNLPESYDDLDNINAKQNMAYAEYIAGLAYSNSGLGICHSIAHAVAAKYRIQHGIALAISLPAVLKYNMYSSSAEKYKYIAEAFGVKTEGLTTDAICRSTIKEIEKFINSFNIPRKYSEYGVKEEDLDSLSLSAYEDACTEGNPRDVTVTEIYLLLKKLI